MSLEYHEELARFAERSAATIEAVAGPRPAPRPITLAEGVENGWIGGEELKRVLGMDSANGPFSPAYAWTSRPWTSFQVRAIGAPKPTVELVEKTIAKACAA